MHYVGIDLHKLFLVASVEDGRGRQDAQRRFGFIAALLKGDPLRDVPQLFIPNACERACPAVPVFQPKEHGPDGSEPWHTAIISVSQDLLRR